MTTASENSKHPAGRPPTYNKETTPEIAYKMKLARHTNNEIAKALGVCRQTFSRWKSEFSELSDALKRADKDGKSIRCRAIESAFDRMINGYTFDEKTYSAKFDENGEPGEMVLIKIVTKYIAPIPAAVIFNAKNWMPERYKDRHDVQAEHTASKGLLEILEAAHKERGKIVQ